MEDVSKSYERILIHLLAEKKLFSDFGGDLDFFVHSGSCIESFTIRS